MNRYEPEFCWEDGKAVCILTDKTGKVYLGTAQCHPEDKDMESEKTGMEIAFKRAKIQLLRGYRDELKIRLSALKQCYHSMNMSYRFNEKSYENKMLQRQIRMINFDLDTVKEMITTEEQSLKEYIQEKDEFYNKIRKQRARRAAQ